MLSFNTWSAMAMGALLGTIGMAGSATGAETLPEVSQLPVFKGLPDPLVSFAGQKVTTKEQWFNERRPELKRLIQHYMYGYLPEAPKNLTTKTERVDEKCFGGKATKKEVTIAFGPAGTPPMSLLVVTPNKRGGPAPVFVGINFYGNHAVLNDPTIALPAAWVPAKSPGAIDNKATEAGRGSQAENWSVEQTIDRGYALATFYCGDLDPDKPDFTDGVHPHYFQPGQTAPAEHDWGTIAAWAWGVHRAVDYVVTDKDLDAKRIAVVGHSRLGKTALLAAAFDDRIALAIPHQAGCGGTAPSRGTVGESVKRINDSFPHWFCDAFPKFNEQVERLPFDQNCLLALCAPRPVLFSNAEEDSWANPHGQFEVLQAADSTYRLVGGQGLEATSVPEMNKLVSSRLGYFIRPGKHSMSKVDWQAFLDFADKNMK